MDLGLVVVDDDVLVPVNDSIALQTVDGRSHLLRKTILLPR